MQQNGDGTAPAKGRAFDNNGDFIAHLRATLAGTVIAPGDPDYDQARLVFEGSFDRRPTAIIRPTDAADATPTPPDLDALVSRVETFLVDEYRKGGVTAQAKARMEGALDSLHSVRKRIGRRQA